MVRIITDSAADFEPAELQQLNITCIPLTVAFGNEVYQENISLSKERFYQLLLTSEYFPQTSQASPQILMDLFEDTKNSGDEAIYITISSAISGTYQTACMIREEVDCHRCYVMDGKNGTGGQRMLVEYAVRLREQGKTAAEIVAGVEAIRGRISLYACVDSLDNLCRGGRISHLAYTMGSIAHIKPVITVEKDGSIGVPAKVMGMKKGMSWLCQQMEKRPRDEDYPVYVMYTNNRTIGETLAEKMRGIGVDVPPERIIPVGAAIGSHVGKDACGFVCVAKE